MINALFQNRLYKQALSNTPYEISSRDIKNDLNTGTADKICASTFGPDKNDNRLCLLSGIQ
jgi:hypothetical protein